MLTTGAWRLANVLHSLDVKWVIDCPPHVPEIRSQARNIFGCKIIGLFSFERVELLYDLTTVSYLFTIVWRAAY